MASLGDGITNQIQVMAPSDPMTIVFFFQVGGAVRVFLHVGAQARGSSIPTAAGSRGPFCGCDPLSLQCASHFSGAHDAGFNRRPGARAAVFLGYQRW